MRQFLKMPPGKLESLLGKVKDAALKHTLAFGVGIHHAGLAESDRTLVEKLFCAQARLIERIPGDRLLAPATSRAAIVSFNAVRARPVATRSSGRG